MLDGREGRFIYAYPRPMLTVDIAVLAGPAENPAVLLIRRRNEPFAGRWALPGGYLEENETPALGAARELREETGLAGLDLRLFGVFGEAGRDPRGWTVSLAYRARLPEEAAPIRAGDDAADAGWFPASDLPPLAFDHGEIVRQAKEGNGDGI